MDRQILIDNLTRNPQEEQRPYTEKHSYGALHQMARGLAVQMRAAAEAKPVCLCSEDRAVVVAALLASLHTGIPLILPHGDAAATLDDLRVEMPYRAAIVDTEADLCLPSEVTALVADAAADAAGAPGGEGALEARLTPDSPWVYLFTGGSTGRSKIWTKTPTNLLAESAYLAERFKVTPADRILSTAPPKHIYGILYSVLMPLLGGAQVCAATPAFPHEILAQLDQSKATILVSLPVHYRSLKAQTYGDHHLRLAFSSAGPLDPADGEAFSAATNAPLYEIYGSTETGGIASRCRHKGETDLTPFAPVRVDVENGCALASSAFISPDLPRDEKGRFLLADRLEATAAGTLRLLGRSDGIVKVGGKRVDLEMVREALKGRKGIIDAVVFNLPGEAGRETEIVAVVEGQAEAADLRHALQGTLEPQALPRRIKVVSQMPMLPTGKYDRQALLDLFGGNRSE
jgi:acyl-coenzyme A synthetase/AMP-(fatty) acid ligase